MATVKIDQIPAPVRVALDLISAMGPLPPFAGDFREVNPERVAYRHALATITEYLLACEKARNSGDQIP